MKKKIKVIVLVVCLFCALIPTPVSAGEGVDYSRITSGTNYKTILQLGNLQFQGTLTRGIGLSQKEQDIIIAKVMNEQKITSGMLINAENILKEAENNGFNLKDAESAVLKLTGADTLVDLYKLLIGTGGGDEVQNVLTNSGLKATELMAKDISTNYTLVAKGGKLALKGATKIAYRLLFLLPDLVEVGLDVLTKYENIKETLALSLEKKGMLDTFYAECNKRIAEAAGDDGEWMIRFDNAKARYSFSMWGIPNLLSEWTLTGELVRQVTGAGDNYGGTYEGLLMLEINGVDMAGSFDARFKDTEIFFNGGGGFVEGEKVLWNMQGMTAPKDDYQTTTLKRTMTGEFTMYILDGGSGAFSPTVLGSLASVGDKTEFSFDHHINANGTFSRAGASIQMVGSIKYTSSDIKSYTFESKNTANGIVLEEDSITRTITTDLGTVWKPLDSEPKFTIYLR